MLRERAMMGKRLQVNQKQPIFRSNGMGSSGPPTH